MTIGLVLIYLSFLATVVSATAFWLNQKSGQENMFDLGKRTFILSSVFITGAVVLMLVLIFTHRFDVSYVYGY
ncbi:MAG: hypothetical protein KAR38_01440, partial [Calditrichia bacterium]|nr:hypothetical protein [Calditrichia bacterium]